MTKRIFRSIFLVSIALLLVSTLFIMSAIFEQFEQNSKIQLEMQTTLAAKGIENEGLDYLNGITATDYRILWISANGEILFDTDNVSSEKEHLLQKEEITGAIKNGFGEGTEYSKNPFARTHHCAKRISDQSVVRMSISQNIFKPIAASMLGPLLFVFLITILMSAILASHLSKQIVKPLNEVDLDKPLENKEYAELYPLLKKLESQKKELTLKEEKLRRQKDEFDTVTVSMREGLILINDKMEILSINRAAKRILKTDSRAKGKNLCLIDDNLDISELLEAALDGEKSVKTFEILDKEYKFSASPIIWNRKVSGAVILIVDVTEKEKSEQMRREFTANVSHELKTPLHSISGYAELLKSGLVKQENTQEFYNKIYLEAQRMINLIEDTIHLSRLDEGADDMKREEFDLFSLAESTLSALSQNAKQAGIRLELSGEPSTITGIKHLISGIIFNLTDNAIKYNKENGSVFVSIIPKKDVTVLSVKDTGIGIPEEYTHRIFERFYRVDKSHSKEVGGTGLGLSIVKHAAKIHNAEIGITSKVGEGTEITVTFNNFEA